MRAKFIAGAGMMKDRLALEISILSLRENKLKNSKSLLSLEKNRKH
jgi:hypothetical protein